MDDDSAQRRGREPSSPPLEMTPERWSALEPLVDEALDFAPDQRSAFVARIAARDRGLAASLERLLGRQAEDDPLLIRAAAERAGLLAGESSRAGPEIRAQLQESLKGSYVIEEELGRGGMSRVFLAVELSLGRRVVIKILAPELAEGLSAERFEREITLLASLQQANIVPLLATGRTTRFPYYTMPFIEGRSLRERLAREGPLAIADGVSVLRDIARALAYAHERGIMHRDIKPANVLLSGHTAVVIDFGIAKAIAAATAGDPKRLTRTGMVIGTPMYMAPEQTEGRPSMDHRADIYAFGCVAFEVFAGVPPFHGYAPPQIVASHLSERPRPLSDVRNDAPAAIGALVARCLEKDPKRRPQSALELLAALDDVRGAARSARPRNAFVTRIVRLGSDVRRWRPW
ncbi:MAG: serine/threonine-protein kinase [bacterium]